MDLKAFLQRLRLRLAVWLNQRRIAAMAREARRRPSYRAMPVLFNEDDHFDFDKPVNNLLSAVGEYASWGFFDPGESNYRDGYQCPPVQWGINTPRKKAFFTLLFVGSQFLFNLLAFQLRLKFAVVDFEQKLSFCDFPAFVKEYAGHSARRFRAQFHFLVSQKSSGCEDLVFEGLRPDYHGIDCDLVPASFSSAARKAFFAVSTGENQQTGQDEG